MLFYTRFTTYIVDKLRPYYASQGGPIVLAQVCIYYVRDEGRRMLLVNSYILHKSMACVARMLSCSAYNFGLCAGLCVARMYARAFICCVHW